jgi:hypothetical protein
MSDLAQIVTATPRKLLLLTNNQEEIKMKKSQKSTNKPAAQPVAVRIDAKGATAKPIVGAKPAKKADKITLEVIAYSERAIAVFGDTKPVKDQLSDLKGKFNRFLTYKGAKTPGWIFSKKQADAVNAFVKSL